VKDIKIFEDIKDGQINIDLSKYIKHTKHRQTRLGMKCRPA